MLSCVRMIRLLAHPLPLARQQVVSLSQSFCMSPVELSGGRDGEGVGEEPIYNAVRKPGPLKIIHYSLFCAFLLKRPGAPEFVPARNDATLYFTYI
jgi:hypothetical protein